MATELELLNASIKFHQNERDKHLDKIIEIKDKEFLDMVVELRLISYNQGAIDALELVRDRHIANNT